MSDTATSHARADWAARLNDGLLLATLLGLAVVLTGASVLQYGDGELPCQLCLLQRVAMLGVAWGVAAHFRWGYSARNIGASLVWATFQLVVSVRQVLLNIYPRPGHAYPGGTVLGLHLPVWSVVIATTLIASFSVELVVFDNMSLRSAHAARALVWAGRLLGLYVLALCALNLASALLQCGLGVCHTTGYKLLPGP